MIVIITVITWCEGIETDFKQFIFGNIWQYLI